MSVRFDSSLCLCLCPYNLRQPLRDSWGLLSHSVCFVCTVLTNASTVPPGTHTAFFSLKLATAVPCGPAVTSLRLTMTSTTLIAISSSCLRTLTLRPLCLRAVTEVDVLHIALGYRFALDMLTISQQHSPTPDHEPCFLTTLSSPHSEHWLHTSAMFVTSTNWLGPRSFQFSSMLCTLECVDNLTHTLSLRDAGTCATRS